MAPLRTGGLGAKGGFHPARPAPPRLPASAASKRASPHPVSTASCLPLAVAGAQTCRPGEGVGGPQPHGRSLMPLPSSLWSARGSPSLALQGGLLTPRQGLRRGRAGHTPKITQAVGHMASNRTPGTGHPLYALASHPRNGRACRNEVGEAGSVARVQRRGRDGPRHCFVWDSRTGLSWDQTPAPPAARSVNLLSAASISSRVKWASF